MKMLGEQIEELKEIAVSIMLYQKTNQKKMDLFGNLEDALTVALAREGLDPGPNDNAKYSEAQWESFVRMLINHLNLQDIHYRVVRGILMAVSIRYGPRKKPSS